jgi:hypothetical protein
LTVAEVTRGCHGHGSVPLLAVFGSPSLGRAAPRQTPSGLGQGPATARVAQQCRRSGRSRWGWVVLNSHWISKAARQGGRQMSCEYSFLSLTKKDFSLYLFLVTLEMWLPEIIKLNVWFAFSAHIRFLWEAFRLLWPQLMS